MAASDLDLFRNETLHDPYPAYEQLRELGPAVYLERHDAWALSHYATARAALLDHETYSSVRGAALNLAANGAFGEAILLQDPPEHATYRRPLNSQLGARQLAGLTSGLAEGADGLVEALVSRRNCDAAAELAQAYVLSVVPDLLGLPDEDRENLLVWSRSVFDAFGAPGERTSQGMNGSGALMAYATSLPQPGRLKADGWGAELLADASNGKITLELAVVTLVAYVIASMVTTIDSIAALVWLLATHPQHWQRVRADPTLIPAVCEEVLRYETPIQVFGRRVTTPTRIGDAVLPADAQVMVLFGSANRDERKWGPTAGQFDPGRGDSGDHLAFSHGPHACAGMGLARQQLHAVLGALVRRVERIELDGPPRRDVNNLLRGFESLPVFLAPSKSGDSSPS